MKRIREVRIESGYYLFKLEHLISVKGISKNKLCRDTNTDFNTVQRICTGNLAKLDLSVLARICDYLECDLNDIVEYKRSISIT